MIDEKALREKLDAMVVAKCMQDWGQLPPPKMRRPEKAWDESIEAVALDLLREKEQRETPCVWSVDDDGIWTATCGEVEWCFNDGGPVENKVKRCYGCGHPVQVKQPQDAAEEE